MQTPDLQSPPAQSDRQRWLADGGRRWWLIQARAVLLRAIRQFFDRRGFVEVDPPAIATSPGLELHLDAVAVDLRPGMDASAPLLRRWLVTSPEYHCKRLLSADLPRIYSMQHAFRSGERGQNHNPEFMMLEWYRAGSSYLDLVADSRALLRHCQKALHQPKLAPLWQLPTPLTPLDALGPWQRVSVREAIARWGGFDPGRMDDAARLRDQALAAGLDVRPGDGAAEVLLQALVERVEPALARLPAVVLDRWPMSLASLARPFDRQPHLAQRFEVYLNGVELANGFTELTDPVEQRRRFEVDLAARRKLGRPAYPIDERFLRALGELPPAAGVALGVDRLLMALTGTQEIGDALAFPFEVA